MTASSGRGTGQGSEALRREVVLPVPAYRRVTSLIGLSLVLVLVASAADAVVWTYQSQRRLWREEAIGTGQTVPRRQLSRTSWHEASPPALTPDEVPPALTPDEGAPPVHGRACAFPRPHD